MQTQVLYETAMEYAALSGQETVVDAYCGTGTIGLIAARRGAKQVVGVEINREAVRDAIANAKRNQIKTPAFIARMPVRGCAIWQRPANRQTLC